MGRSIDDLLSQMRNSPAGIRFVDACKVVDHFFGGSRQSGSSHRIWKLPWPGDPRVNLQIGENGKAKAYPVRQALAAIDMVTRHRPAATVASTPPAPSKEHRKSRR